MVSSKYLTNLLIDQFRSVAPQKRKVVILLTVAVLFGGAIMLRSVLSKVCPEPRLPDGQGSRRVEGSALLAADGSGSKNPRFDANSSLVGQRDFSAKPAEDLGRGELFFKMMFSVVLVLVLGAAAVYMSKKVLPRITNLPGKEIRILETAHLGPRKAVHLISIGNQRLLIGSTNESITMLADVTEQDEPDFVDPSSQQVDACVRR